MANEVESTEEMLALQEKIGKLVESGWSDDPDDHYALRLMWYAGRDWERQRVHQNAVERSRLTTREDDLGEAG